MTSAPSRRVPGVGLPSVLFTATAMLSITAVALSWGLEPAWDTALYAVYSVTLAGVGTLIVSRYPRHRIGWLFVVAALFNVLAADVAEGWGLRAAQEGWTGGTTAEVIAASHWLASGVLGLLTFLLFPDGHLTSRRWAWVAVAGVAGAMLAIPGWAFDPGIDEEFASGRNPIAVEHLPTGLMFAVGFSVFVVAHAASVASLLIRLRRAAGVERLQLQWFAYVAAASAVVPPLVAALWFSVPALRPVTALVLTAMPLAAGVAILRYRLYDIDVVVSRTVLYSVLTVMLAGTYAATAVLLGASIGNGAVTVAIATLTAAAAFRPLRDRLQGLVDRRFSRARYEAAAYMAAFVNDLRVGHRSPEDLLASLRIAIGDPRLELRFLLPDNDLYVDHNGAVIPGAIPSDWHRTPIQSATTTLGEIVQPPGTDRQRALIPQAVAAGALAIEIARLRVELRRQLEEVRASRSRVAAAAEHERRRIERDLHDGAQQRLVAIGLALRHAQHQLGTGGAAEAALTIDNVVDEIAEAISDLREMAQGIRPAMLDAGLAPALRELAKRSPLPVEVRSNAHRITPELETTAYFTACEALTNAIKHAQASRIVIDVAATDHLVVVTITDDGVGGADPRHGSGLTGLADRVATHGGTLRIHSPAGAGTSLSAELPCGS